MNKLFFIVKTHFMNITCRKTCCKFNENFVCMAKGIDISPRALCHTFENGDCAPDTTKSLLKKTPRYHRYRPRKTLNIKCMAKCQFNCEGCCLANGITINSLDEKPYCITFFKKLKK